MSLHPDHLADLKKSGLSDEMIERAGIYTVIPDQISKKLGASYLHESHFVESCYAIPYFGCKGFERFKVFPGHTDKSGHKVKYIQPKGSGVNLYIPPSVEHLLSDAKVPLRITEGEKKALKATQEGISTVGIGGVWNWTPELFDEIVTVDREIELVPDSDFVSNRNVTLAVYRLARLFEKRGAIVSIVTL